MLKTIGLVGMMTLATSLMGCGIFEDVTEQVVEGELGCSEQQLAPIQEPALPNCSKVAACCKFLKGECGAIKYFTPPEGVLAFCNANEELFLGFISTYDQISDGQCPEYLTDEACSGSVDETRNTYVSVVDQGVLEGASSEFLSCSDMVEATVVPLNEALGATAALLPAACEL